MARKKTTELKSSLDARESRGDRIAIAISNILGSLPLLLGYAAFLIIYMLWNVGWIPGLKPFDNSRLIN